MKKIFYAFLLLFIIAEANAQITYNIGVRGGLVSGRFQNYNLKGGKKSSYLGRLSPRIGGGAGVYGKVWFNKFVGVNLGVEFNMGGNTEKEQHRAGPRGLLLAEKITEHKFNYITIPLVAHVGWGIERVRIYGTVGGYYALPIYGRYGVIEYLDKEKISEVRGDANFDQEFSKMDAGLRFGAGLEAFVSKNKQHGVTFDATFDWGFTKVYQERYVNLHENEGVRFTNTRTLVEIGYIYKFNRDNSGDKAKKDKKAKAEKAPKEKKVKEEKAPKEKKAKKNKDGEATDEGAVEEGATDGNAATDVNAAEENAAGVNAAEGSATDENAPKEEKKAKKEKAPKEKKGKAEKTIEETPEPKGMMTD
jgi:hypothetical protein